MPLILACEMAVLAHFQYLISEHFSWKKTLYQEQQKCHPRLYFGGIPKQLFVLQSDRLIDEYLLIQPVQNRCIHLVHLVG